MLEEIKNQELAAKAAAKAEAEKQAELRRMDPEQQAKRQQFLAIQKKINDGNVIGWEEQIALAAAKPTYDEPVQRHAKWLMKKLYEQRERNGDVVFVFPSGDGGLPEIDIPVPEHALANKPAE